MPLPAPTLTLIRNATVLLDLGVGPTLLVDPMLNPAGAAPPVEHTAPELRNPLVELPLPAEEVVDAADAVLVTHLHNDHFDAAAREGLPREIALLCQPADRDTIAEHGFTAITVVNEVLELADGLTVHRVPARHTLGEHETALGPVSGYVVSAPGQPTVYIAADSVWCDEVAATIDAFSPHVVVLNAGAARFLTGSAITMTVEDLVAAARHAADAQVIVVHLEALNHCPMRRDELRRHLVSAGLAERVAIPADGERTALVARS